MGLSIYAIKLRQLLSSLNFKLIYLQDIFTFENSGFLQSHDFSKPVSSNSEEQLGYCIEM